MGDEDDEFFEALEDLPPSPKKGLSPPKAVNPETADGAEISGQWGASDPQQSRQRSHTIAGGLPAASKGRERSATVGSRGGELDLSVWKAGPSSVRERRERFWQSQGGGPLAGVNSFGGPPAAGSLPARRGSAVQGRVSGSERDSSWQEAKIEKRRSSEGGRRLTIGFDAKGSAQSEALPPPVAFVVSSQGSTSISDSQLKAAGSPSGLTSALANYAPQLLKEKAIEGGRPRAETAPALYKIGDILASGTPSADKVVSALPPRGPSQAVSCENGASHSEAIKAQAQDARALSSSLPGVQANAVYSSRLTSQPLAKPEGLTQLKIVQLPKEIVPAIQPLVTEKARPWPKRHQRTASEESQASPSGGVSPSAFKSPLQQAKNILGQVTNHLGHKSPKGKANGASLGDGSPSSSGSTELERDVLRLGRSGEAEVDSQASVPASPSNVAVDIVYRIKNLDTGKEFLLEQSADKVKDVNSGKELSMDDIEESLGLSPVMREVQRREQLALQGGEAEGDLAKKKKGWLNKTLKMGAAYYTKGRRKMQQRDVETEGSGSDTDRRPFVHGRGGFADARVAGYGPGYEPGPNGKGSVKVHVQKKAYKELTDVRVGQEIKAHDGPIWCMKFNSDGRFLATGGKDGLVKIWEVVDTLPPTPLQASGDFDELVPTSDDLISDDILENGRRTSRDRSTSWGASFWLADVAYRTLRGHSTDVLELSWSKNTQFLLSSSMDTTVRLWHVSMDECLRVFPHNDFVTCLDFNPADDKFFISGSLDNKVRIWNIPEHRVVDWTDMHEMVTACTYTSDGKGAIVGSYEGTCRFYKMSKHLLQLDGTLDVRSTRGKNARGKKVTGVQCMPGDPRKILVTSNDSRLRVYDGMNLCCKYKGHANANSQKAASFTAGGDYLVCPSEDGFVYIWGAANSYVPPYGGFRKDRHQSCEYFYSHAVNVAVAWCGPKVGSLETDGAQRKSRSRANSGGKAEMSGLKLPTKSAREVPLGSWPKEALGEHKASEGARGGPGPWAETRHESESAATAVSEAATAGESAVAAAGALGLVIVTASYQGEIRTFKNFGRPAWL